MIPPRGRICLDGIDIRQLDPHWLREQIGLVMQDVFVIPASLRDNILLDRELPESELRRIIDLAQLTRVVKNLPHGLDTAIGEGGLDLPRPTTVAGFCQGAGAQPEHSGAG